MPSIDCNLCSLDFPANVLDADFIARLFIVIKPFAVRQIDASELGTGIRSFSQPLSLDVRTH